MGYDHFARFVADRPCIGSKLIALYGVVLPTKQIGQSKAKKQKHEIEEEEERRRRKEEKEKKKNADKPLFSQTLVEACISKDFSPLNYSVNNRSMHGRQENSSVSNNEAGKKRSIFGFIADHG